ncbi:MAG: TIGR04282 family arsenosugar biosynthesis glycosyltransferase [Candidatus Coatesbacteria bacterium]
MGLAGTPAAPAGLALFLSAPESGPVAARLSAAWGPDRAARFGWECALLVMAKALRLKGADVFVFVTPAERQAEIESQVMTRFGRFEGRFLAQRGNTPGERVNHALERLRVMGYDRQLVLGTDSPTIPLEYLQRAVDELADADGVIGPTWAGGYYLIGIRRPDVRIFRDVRWGSGLELEQTWGNLAGLGLTFRMLPRWQNVDSEDDLPFLEGQVRHADYRRLRAILDEPAAP